MAHPAFITNPSRSLMEMPIISPRPAGSTAVGSGRESVLNQICMASSEGVITEFADTQNGENEKQKLK